MNLFACKEEAVKRERAEDEAYAQTVIADTELELQKEQEKKELAKARALIQQSSLNEQVKLVRERKAKEVGAGEMTSLEASLNRGLLVSIVQHKYPNPNILN